MTKHCHIFLQFISIIKNRFFVVYTTNYSLLYRYRYRYIYTYIRIHMCIRTCIRIRMIRWKFIWINRAIARVIWTEGNVVGARRVSRIVLNERDRDEKGGWRNKRRKTGHTRVCDHHSIFNGRQLANVHLDTRSIMYTVVPWPREYKF